MSPETLQRHFEVLADAPNGVQKLRELILQLAVRGKLVPQDPTDEPASVLLERIAAEKRRLSEEGRIGRSKTLTPIREDEVPYEAPHGWEWVRIGVAMDLVNGRAFKPAEWSANGTPIVRIQNLNNPDVSFNYCDFEVADKFYVEDEDLLLSWSGTPGTSFGAFVWRRGRAVLNQHIFRCELHGHGYTNDFARLAINSRLDEMIAQAHGGVGLQHVTKGKLDNLLIPLPPLAEQRRIVAKVDELIALCDRLESQQRRRSKARVRLNRSVLHHLATSNDADSAAGWDRLRENFHLLYDTPETVAELRQTVLQLAVRGKLVPQDPADEPSSMLLDRIVGEKQRHPGRKKVRRPELELPRAGAGFPFEVPERWAWTRLAELITEGPQNGYSPKPLDYPSETRALTLTATTSGTFDGRHFKYIADSIPHGSTYWLEPDDLLFQRGNSLEYVGTAAVYDGEHHSFIYPDLMIRVRCSKLISVRFVHLVANSFIGRAHFRGRASGTSGSMPKINQGDVLELAIPLPPVAEQRRIVAKVDELRALCDRLESQLVTARGKSAHLAASLVHHLVV